MKKRISLAHCLVLTGVAVLGAGLSASRTWIKDPRDSKRVEELVKIRERDAFRERLRRGDENVFPWPGLSAMQVSWIWLEMLNGLHHPDSYNGDFSWLFSKLNTIVQVARPEELTFIASLAPYYYVIGKDYAGATYVMNEMVRRSGAKLWTPWFWGGIHAMENLSSPRLAGDLMMHAASHPSTPTYFAALAVRLSKGQEFLDSSSKREILEKELSPELLEKIRKSRPEWVK